MFGRKTKRIKELEAELSAANNAKFDLAAANDTIKNQNARLISEKSGLSIQIKELQEWKEQHQGGTIKLSGEIDKLNVEIESLKSKLTRKKPIKKSAQ